MKVLAILPLCLSTVYCSTSGSNPLSAQPSNLPPNQNAYDLDARFGAPDSDSLAIDRLRQKGKQLLSSCRTPRHPEDTRFEREITKMRSMIQKNAHEERNCSHKWRGMMPASLVRAYLHYLEWQDKWLGKLMGRLQGSSCKGSAALVREPPKYQEILRRDGMQVKRRTVRRRGAVRGKLVRRVVRVKRTSGGSYSSGGSSYSTSGGSASGSASMSTGGSVRGNPRIRIVRTRTITDTAKCRLVPPPAPFNRAILWKSQSSVSCMVEITSNVYHTDSFDRLSILQILTSLYG
ncbi:hypothetical protein PSACC_01208 [Paramicrosporidium saccamoebae]|uniref:Uncharacterized protein n=1 Tax=Paramicrosporidium saccamoebae TaxID=1246581 RepID=A0A2H9TMJ5_9FUNG|nr:hypothetical protein PSACC_01208 [Paramicrosporidium saccamoebae]